MLAYTTFRDTTTFDTEMPIRTRIHERYQHVAAAIRTRIRTRIRTCYQHVVVPARTCPPASLPSANAGAHKSLVAERYQAFSEAKCLS